MALTSLGSTAKIPKPLLIVCAVLFVGLVTFSTIDGNRLQSGQSGIKWNRISIITGRGGWLKSPGARALPPLPGNEKHLPILAFFSSSDCPYCKLMEKTAFCDKAIYEVINANFFPVLVDEAKRRGISSTNYGYRSFDDKYRSMMVPRIVIAAADGAPLFSFSGVRSCSKTYSFLKVSVKYLQDYKERESRAKSKSVDKTPSESENVD